MPYTWIFSLKVDAVVHFYNCFDIKTYSYVSVSVISVQDSEVSSEYKAEMMRNWTALKTSNLN